MEICRFISPILAIRNYHILEVSVDHKEREFGKSNYGLADFVPVLVDGFIFYFSNGFTNLKSILWRKFQFTHFPFLL